jgi:zinc transporter ZupT
MLFVVVDELVPEAVRQGRGITVMGLFAVGFAVIAGLV